MSDIESRFVSGVGTVISYLGDDRVRLRDMFMDIEMTAAEAGRLAQALSDAANEATRLVS
jgi:hypothetical protein